VRSSAASNRFHIRLIIPESRIVEGHVFIRNVRVGLPERLLLASAAGALGPTRKGIDHLPAAPHGQVHMGKLGLPCKPDQSQWTAPIARLTGPNQTPVTAP